MAAEILQQKHRFILVSDLDWTMVNLRSKPDRRSKNDGFANRAPELRVLLWSGPYSAQCNLQVDHEDKQHKALDRFGQLWKDKFAADSLLVFSTGRSLALYEELRVCLAPAHNSVCLAAQRLHLSGNVCNGICASSVLLK